MDEEGRHGKPAALCGRFSDHRAGCGCRRVWWRGWCCDGRRAAAVLGLHHSVSGFARGRPCAALVKFALERRICMDWNRIEGNWKQFKGKVKEQWGKITDDELDEIAGRRDQLEGKIQERYGMAKDKVRSDVDTWLSRH